MPNIGIGLPEIIVICSCAAVLALGGVGVAIWQLTKKKK
jgi:hypothetical protein